MEQMPVKCWERDEDYVQMEISVEMNFDQLVFARNGYTFLDYLSDIGGMTGMLMSLATIILAFWNYNMLYDSMVIRLFKLKPKHIKIQELQEALEMKALCF